jgi:hypothetical protein
MNLDFRRLFNKYAIGFIHGVWLLIYSMKCSYSRKIIHDVPTKVHEILDELPVVILIRIADEFYSTSYGSLHSLEVKSSLRKWQQEEDVDADAIKEKKESFKYKKDDTQYFFFVDSADEILNRIIAMEVMTS